MASSPSATQRPVSSNKGNDGGPVGNLYSKIATGGFGLWLSAVVVLGLSAGVISKTPPSPLRSAASYNLAVSALEFFLAFSSITKPVSPTNARPPAWFIVILVFTTMMWAAAFPLMFVMRSNCDTVVSSLQNITIACGCMGVSAFIFIFYTGVLRVSIVPGKIYSLGDSPGL